MVNSKNNKELENDASGDLRDQLGAREATEPREDEREEAVPESIVSSSTGIEIKPVEHTMEDRKSTRLNSSHAR